LSLVLPALACEDLSVDSTGASVAFSGEDIALLPAGFPLYPKAFSTASIDTLVTVAVADLTTQAAIDAVASEICATLGAVEICLDELLVAGDYSAIDEAIAERVPQITEWVEDTLVRRIRFYNTVPLSAGISEQLGRTLVGAVTFDAVSLSMTVTNRTDQVWGVPVRLSMYMGDGEGVAGRSALVQSSGTSTGYTALLEPGQTTTIETGNVTGLVDALNEFRSLSVDYEADIEVADLDVDSFSGWWDASRETDADGNGVADELAGWALTVDDIRITVSGRGEIAFPEDVPSWLDTWLP